MLWQRDQIRRENLFKRFVFQNEDTRERVFIVDISLFVIDKQLRLCDILFHLNKKGLNIKDYKFQMPDEGIEIQAGDKCRVPFERMRNKKQFVFHMKLIYKQSEIQDTHFLYEQPQLNNISLHNLALSDLNQGRDQIESQFCTNFNFSYTPQSFENKQVSSQGTNEQSEKEKEFFKITQSPKQQQVNDYYIPGYQIKVKVQGQNKKTKEQEKTIYEALYKTKTWRLIHDTFNLSLQNAAKIVQLSKKTLDDYFLVLRVGQQHKYNFSKYLNEKIGHLRAFIRKQPIKVTGRMVKQVKSFSLVPDPSFKDLPLITDWSRCNEIHEVVNDNDNGLNSQKRIEKNSEMMHQ